MVTSERIQADPIRDMVIRYLREGGDIRQKPGVSKINTLDEVEPNSGILILGDGDVAIAELHVRENSLAYVAPGFEVIDLNGPAFPSLTLRPAEIYRPDYDVRDMGLTLRHDGRLTLSIAQVSLKKDIFYKVR